ncbi:hypothetical protein [Aestuariivirga sp.]|uniref:hypothetical protein n=1 Tax=Aestuariivirga sp. TaxID=2650926 RepID=UPI0025B9EBE8|nr:hypothetical protein [Aestuariivirga sp.]MCA3555863.1 hypothetical protein [Aestuariivirga sp.]
MTISPQLIKDASQASSGNAVHIGLQEMLTYRIGNTSDKPSLLTDPDICRDPAAAANCVLRAGSS